MLAFTDFLANNYLWFLVISIVLLFALIGYFVDQNEQKKGLSKIVKAKEIENNISDLAAYAQNKSLNNAVSDAIKNDMPAPINQAIPNITQSQVLPAEKNIIRETSNVNQSTQQIVSNPVGFDVLTK